MKRQSPTPRLVEILRDIEAIPSPSGFTHEVILHIQKLARGAGLHAEITNKGCLLVGNHPAPKIVVAGHVDTLGAMVSGIQSDGTLSITKVGGLLLPTFEGSYVTIATSSGKRYSGTLLLKNPAAHVNRAAESSERKPEVMQIRLDAETRSKTDTQKLGIGIGDFILFDSRFQYTDTGFIKAHFLDDKAGSATMIDAMLTLGAATLKKLPVAFFFSTYEEVGHGACAGLPATAEEMLVVDMGVVGTDVEGDEYSVSICVKDSTGPYDYDLRCRLQKLAKAKKIPHQLDVFPFYGSDGSVALRAGYNFRVGLIGPGVSASHGMERTHIRGLTATRDLLLAYLKAGAA